MYAVIGHPVLDELSRPLVAHVIEEATDVRIEHPIHLLPLQSDDERIERLMGTAARTEPIGEALEVDLINRSRIVTTACWTILSSSAATPNGRCRPSAFGI